MGADAAATPARAQPHLIPNSSTRFALNAMTVNLLQLRLFNVDHNQLNGSIPSLASLTRMVKFDIVRR
jgi:hypothetical protein